MGAFLLGVSLRSLLPRKAGKVAPEGWRKGREQSELATFQNHWKQWYRLYPI